VKRNQVPVLAAVLSVAVVLLVIAGMGRFADSSDRTRERSIAVLPVENLSGDREQDYVAEGMTDALIGDLAKIKFLRVISRNSVMGYKVNRKPAAQMASELHADALVEGSVWRFGNRVRINVHLTAGAVDRTLWSQSYEGELRDVSALQNEAAKAIAWEIQINGRILGRAPPTFLACGTRSDRCLQPYGRRAFGRFCLLRKDSARPCCSVLLATRCKAQFGRHRVKVQRF